MPTELPSVEPARCLVVAPRSSSLLLLYRGVFEALANPRRLLVLATRDGQAAVFDPTLLRLRMRYQPGQVHLPISIPRDQLDMDSLRRLAFSEAVLLEPTWADARVVAAAGIGRRTTFRRGWAGRFVPLPVPDPERDPASHAETDFWPLVRAIGTPGSEIAPTEIDPDRPTPKIHVPDVWNEVGRERLIRAKIDLEGAPVVGVYLGNDDGSTGSRWPAERFESLLRELRRRRPSWQIVILTPDADLWKSVLLYERTGKIHPVIGPDLARDGLAAVLARLDLFVAADSWLLQLAAAVGTATLGLFEARAGRYAPLGEQHRYLQTKPLKKLEVKEVLDAALEAVGGEGSESRSADGADGADGAKATE